MLCHLPPVSKSQLKMNSFTETFKDFAKILLSLSDIRRTSI